MKNKNLKVCSRCIYDENVPNISFDDNGECNYCKMIDNLQNDYQTGTPSGEEKFLKIVEEIKIAGKGKVYDCIVGASGGTDSSYMLYLAKKHGLRPLAVHYDNTWNSAIATENIRKVTTKLGLDLYTHVVDNAESDDIFKSFFKAGVVEFDGPTDIALAEVMYRAAAKYKIRYVLEGHSFRAEGVSPLGNAYVDGKYIKTVHKEFGSIPMKTFPNMSFLSFLKWIMFYKIQKIRPYWYIDYDKQSAKKFLEKEYDWKYYGGHHLENRATAFTHAYLYPKRFNYDSRNNSLSAQVRSGLMSREDALKEYYEKETLLEPELLNYVKKRLKMSDEEFEKLMNAPRKTYRDYKTYKERFELFRPLFYVLAKANLVPMSFYLKYCFPIKKNDKK
ncbi:N-acetyl sugar amidotransferase [Aliarcobacter cryaerophilus]|uniref:N-acetyl sugar amidotransferase n=1 Tax=Aliarcobacter cryaerophilus TaxID=28198 RepID=UPI0021B5F9DF|nr:N-acetyl sugar amidotransferase [Aliarcobacter cryaerophilus]MCT7531807.1 N-acetyl sugar amidotransferase [Aliarcobacter cryaerophilus]